MKSKINAFCRTLIVRTPKIREPTREVGKKERLIWTFVILVIYLVLSSTPLLGVYFGEGGDPFSFLRVVTASNYRFLTELGVGPILIAGLIMQLLVGVKIIKVDLEDPAARSFYNDTQKTLSIGLTIIIALILVVGGYYGTYYDLSLTDQSIILIQLLGAGVIIIALNEFLQQGWGLGSGVSLFLIGNVALQIFLGLFSIQNFLEGPNEIMSNRGIVFALIAWIASEGIFPTVQALFFRYDPLNNINLPHLSLLSVLATCIVIIIIILLQSMEVIIPTSQTDDTEISLIYNINLLYNSTVPVFLTSILFVSLHYISYMIWLLTRDGQTGSNLLTQILGSYSYDDIAQRYVATGGLIYFLTPPNSFIGDYGVINPVDPLPSIIRALIYVLIFISLTVLFSIKWLEMIGLMSPDAAKQFLISGMRIQSGKIYQDITHYKTRNYLRKIALVGGGLISSVTVLADFFGVLGSGLGLLLFICLIHQYYVLVFTDENSADQLLLIKNI